MKAIDFACRFLTRVQKDDLSPAARLVLVAVGAGLEDKHDISRETRMSPSVCTLQLRLLEQKGEVRCLSHLSERYVLAPAGKARLRSLFDFNLSPHGPEKVSQR